MLSYLEKSEFEIINQNSLKPLSDPFFQDSIDLSGGLSQYYFFTKRTITVLHDRIVNNV